MRTRTSITTFTLATLSVLALTAPLTATSAHASTPVSAPSAAGSVVPTTNLDLKPAIMQCSPTEGPIYWTMTSVSKYAKYVPAAAAEATKAFKAISKATGGRFTYEYVPNAPVTATQLFLADPPTSGQFLVSTDPRVAFVINLGQYGPVDESHPLNLRPGLTQVTDSWPWSSYNSPADAPLWSVSNSFPGEIAKKITHPDVRKFITRVALTSVTQSRLPSGTGLTAKIKKDLRTLATNACDPNYPRNYRPRPPGATGMDSFLL